MKIVIIIIIISGLIGGLTNFLKDVLDNAPKNKWLKFFYHILFSLIASALVPLFLKIISSDIFTSIFESSSENTNLKDYFIFSGFCLLASLSSKLFIDNLTSNIFKEKVKNMEQSIVKQDEIINDMITEKEIDKKSIKKIISENPNLCKHTNDILKILPALYLTTYRWRTSKGMAEDIKMEEKKVLNTLEILIENNIVKKEIVSKGNEIHYKLTEEGKKIMKK